MTRKDKIVFSPKQKLEYAKLMIEDGYTNKQIEEMSGACVGCFKMESAISGGITRQNTCEC